MNISVYIHFVYARVIIIILILRNFNFRRGSVIVNACT